MSGAGEALSLEARAGLRMDSAEVEERIKSTNRAVWRLRQIECRVSEAQIFEVRKSRLLRFFLQAQR